MTYPSIEQQAAAMERAQDNLDPDLDVRLDPAAESDYDAYARARQEELDNRLTPTEALRLVTMVAAVVQNTRALLNTPLATSQAIRDRMQTDIAHDERLLAKLRVQARA